MREGGEVGREGGERDRGREKERGKERKRERGGVEREREGGGERERENGVKPLEQHLGSEPSWSSLWVQSLAGADLGFRA